MRKHIFRLNYVTSAIALGLGGLVAMQVADAGPGIAPVYSATAAPPPAAPDTFAQTFYANSPLGPRVDLVANPTNPINPAGPFIDTGTAMRKFVDILPGVHAFAPSTNIGTGTTGASAKYIPVAVPSKWPTDGADYYHIAAVEYTEQLHSDLPKATTLRGYVQIEEPGATSTPAGSKHIALSYPDGTPITLPNAAGVQVQVYAYDNPHYMGPMISATKDVAVRIKYSNLLPVGDASGKDPWGGTLGNGVASRNGDLPIPADATLAGGALPQNRIDIHLHGGLTPWISDGNPHQWTIPVGDTRYSYLSDIAVTAVGAGYTAPTLTIDPPQSIATGKATLALGSVKSLNVVNPGAYYSVSAPPAVTIDPPAAGGVVTPATATATALAGKVSALTPVAAGLGYLTAPAVTISAPTTSVSALATATTSTTAAATTGGTVTAVALAANGNVGYAAAPTVTIAAPATQVPATATIGAPSAATGALGALANNANFGYWAAPAAPSLTAPPAAVNATGTTTVAANAANGKSPAVTTIAVNANNFGYWSGSNVPAVTIAAPPAAVTATTAGVVGAGNLNNGYVGNLGTFRVANGTTNFGYWNNAASNVAGSLITVSAPQALAPTALTYTVGANGTITVVGVATAANFGYDGNNNINTAAAIPAPAPAVNAAHGAVTLTAGKPTTTITNAATNWGYFAAPQVTLTGGTHGAGTITATAQIAGGRVTGITYTGTASYTVAPTITIAAAPASRPFTLVNNANGAGGVLTVSAGGNTVLNLGNAGRGYVPGTYTTTATVPVNMTSVQAVVTPTIGTGVNAGRLTGLTLTTAGSGYTPTNPLTITIGAPVASVTATATPVLAGGKITGFTISGGANYTAAPAVTIGAALAGTQATATASVNAATGVLTYTLTNAGAGYVVAPTITAPAPVTSVQATATAAINTTGNVTSVTLANKGANYLPGSVPLVTVGAAPVAVQATATSAISAVNGAVTGYTLTNAGYGYWTTPTVALAAPPVPVPATATAVVAPDGTIAGLNITNAGAGYVVVPKVTIAWPATAIQATATPTVTAGAITGVTLTNIGRGYLTTPNVTITDPSATATGAAINALVALPIGPGFHQVPDMAGNLDPTKVPAGYVSPITGEGTVYYTNNQSERLMWYHDHTSGTTRLNVYEGLVAPFLLTDPAVDPVLPGATVPTVAPALQGLVPGEQIALVLQDKTFVPKDITQQDANWDTTHWGNYGDLWFPHVYETNQNPSFLHSLSNLGRWDWGPWFAIVYPALYSLPTGKYGDVTLTPESYEDTATVNGAAYPTVTVEPRAYRFRLLNGANDRFMNLGFYLADTAQPAAFADPLHAAGTNYTEVQQFSPTGAQPSAASVTVTLQNGTTVTQPVAPNVFQANPAYLPWPADGGSAGPGATRFVPTPSSMGPPIISIGNEGGVLPTWVQHDPIPVNYDYNRRSVTVLNLSQSNDITQQCYPECHGLYLGPAERADFVVDFAPYAGKTLILYNDAPAPNPAFDSRIDYYTGDDATGTLNYATGGAPNTQPGYGPNTRTMLQVIVGTVQNASGTDPIDYTSAEGTPTAGGLITWDPTKLGAGKVLGALTSNTPGPIQQLYSATQPAPIVGESAYNIAFNPTTQTANAAKGIVTSAGGYVDEYGNMYLGSQNQPEFYVTNPGPLTLTAIAVTGNTTATGAASGIGLGAGSTGSNAGAGSGTSYTSPPAVVISAPTACTAPGTQALPCRTATGTAAIANGQVVSVALTDPGAGYTEVPSVLLVSSGGAVNAISVTNGGSGYLTAPTVTVSPPCTPALATSTAPAVVCPSTDVQATATATINAAGAISGITITNAGAGYSTVPTVTISAPASLVAPTFATALNTTGGLASVTATGGAGYTGAPALTISAPPALTAAGAATATLAATGGSIGTITLATPGANYVTAPTVQVAAPVTVAATGTATVTGGVVSIIPANPAGVNYYGVAPTVTIDPPTAATPATITAIYTTAGTSTYLTGFTVVNAGSGYTTAPVITDTTCSGAGQAVLNATGGIASVTLTAIGLAGNCAATDTLSFSSTPSAGTQATAVATLDATGTFVASVTVSGGSGYLTVPKVTFSAPVATPATATATIGTGGTLTIAVANAGSGYPAAPAVTLVGGAGGVTATATATVAGGTISAVTVTNPGSGYTAAPTVALTGGTGTAQATAVAAVSSGGYGATAIAIASTTKVFISPAAVPGNIVPPTPGAVPLTLTPAVASLLGCNAAQTSCTNLSSAVVGRLQNPAIQELFEPFYGRMNATLGIEMPNQSLTVQTTLPLNYIDPGTEMWEYGKPVMWKVTHNGVDAHPVHIHLVNAQVINRVGWDGTVKQPEDDEIGWKETIKMNPLEDIILAMIPSIPQVPFGLERSIRAQDASQPLGVNLGFTQYTVEGFSGAVGAQTVKGDTNPLVTSQHDSAFFAAGGANWGGVYGHTSVQAGYISATALGVGDAATVVNSMENFDNEYVWHCHILGHEENDFMRPISVLSNPVVPPAPTAVVATQAAGAGAVVTWVDPTPIAVPTPVAPVVGLSLATFNSTYGNQANEIGFLVQRSTDGGTTWVNATSAAANVTTATDPMVLPVGTAVLYRVVGYNAQGVGAPGTAASITAQ